MSVTIGSISDAAMPGELLDANTALLSLVLTAQPLTRDYRPRPLGRALHAILLRSLQQEDAALAQAIHDSSGPKPFTVSDLFEHEGQLTLRLTALTRSVAQTLIQAVTVGALQPGAMLNLDGLKLRVTGVVTRREQHLWAGQASYGALALPWLYQQAEPEIRLAFEFASPVTFKSNDMNVPVPMPQWVFGGLLDRWNTFAPVPLPEIVREFAALRKALSRYELRTVAVPFKPGTVKFGAVGYGVYTAPHPDEALLSALNLLSDFAFYAGVGAQTTMGFGQCRPVEVR
jgi:CRISPR-associated endoribonuclease Cas6